MNQILYKGYTFGGVGEDVTNKQYGTVTIHNPITDQDETYNPVGGENSEIFNAYKSGLRNIASTDYTTIFGYSNKDLIQDGITGCNLIGGQYNINIGHHNNISGYSNFLNGFYNLITGMNNKIEGDSFLVSGHNNKAIKSTIGLGVANGIIGQYNTIIGDYSGCFIAGSRNTIDTSSIGGGNRGHMTVTGLNNYLKDSDESLVTGDGNKVSGSVSTLVFGIENDIKGSCNMSLIGGYKNTINFGGSDNIICGDQLTLSGVSQAIINGNNSVHSSTITSSLFIPRYSNFSDVINSSLITTDNSNVAGAINYSIINLNTCTLNSIINSTLNLKNSTVTSNITYSLVHGTIKAVSINHSLIFEEVDTNANIGYSAIIGNGNTTKYNNAYILQSGETIQHSVIIGESNIFSNLTNNIILGNNNDIRSTTVGNESNNITIGFSNTVNQSKGYIFGKNNSLNGGTNDSYIIGDGNSLTDAAIYNFILGKGNTTSQGVNYSEIIGINNTIIQASSYSCVIGSNNTISQGAQKSISIGNNIQNIFVNGIVLGYYNSYPNTQNLVTDKLLILGNGDSTTRSNCLEINTDGSQEIILKDKNLSNTLGIGKIKIKQEKIIFESLKENSSQQIETVEFTFEDLKQIKQNSQLPNLDNNSYPTT